MVHMDWQKDQFEALEKRCLKAMVETPHDAQKTCALITKYGTDVSGGIEKYDIRYFESNNTA